MSFGIRDIDWVDPDPEPVVKCRDCEYYDPCPCGCAHGWCTYHEQFTEENEECD